MHNMRPSQTFGVLFVMALCTMAPLQGALSEGTSVTLTLVPSELQVKADENRVLFEPDRRRRRATYYTYIFSLSEFREKVGDPKTLKGPVSLTVKITKVAQKNFKPSDERMPSPYGGFNYYYYTCSIVAKVLKE